MFKKKNPGFVRHFKYMATWLTMDALGEENKELQSRRVKSGDHSRKYKILQDCLTNTRCHPI